MKQVFRAKNLDQALQALNYAESQGFGRKKARIEEENGRVRAEIEFSRDLTDEHLRQIQDYTATQGVNWE